MTPHVSDPYLSGEAGQSASDAASRPDAILARAKDHAEDAWARWLADPLDLRRYDAMLLAVRGLQQITRDIETGRHAASRPRAQRHIQRSVTT